MQFYTLYFVNLFTTVMFRAMYVCIMRMFVYVKYFNRNAFKFSSILSFA